EPLSPARDDDVEPVGIGVEAEDGCILLAHENGVRELALKLRATLLAEGRRKVGDVLVPVRIRNRIEHGDRGVEVVEAGVDELEAHDLAPENAGDLIVAARVAAETITAKDDVTDEQEVALTLVGVLGLTNLETVLAEPLHVRGALWHALV